MMIMMKTLAILLINLLIIANCQGPPLDDDCVVTCCPDVIPSDDNITTGSVPGVRWACCLCNAGFYLSQPCEHFQPNTRVCSPCQFVEDDPHRQFYIDDGPHNRETCTKSIAICPHGELRVKGNTTSPATCVLQQVSSTQSNAVTTTPGNVEPVQSGIFLSSGAIAMLFVIPFIIVVLTLVVVYCCKKRKKDAVKKPEQGNGDEKKPLHKNGEEVNGRLSGKTLEVVELDTMDTSSGGNELTGDRPQHRASSTSNNQASSTSNNQASSTSNNQASSTSNNQASSTSNNQASSTSNNQAKTPTSDGPTDSNEAIDGKPGTSGISKGKMVDDIPDGSVMDDNDEIQTLTDVIVSNGDIKLSSIPDEQNSPHQSRSDQSATSSGAARKPTKKETQTESHVQTMWKLYHKLEEGKYLSWEQMYHLLRSFGRRRIVDDFIRHQTSSNEIVAQGFHALIDLGSETFNLQTIYDYFSKQDLMLFTEQIEEFCEKNGFELAKAENTESENKDDELVEQTTVKETLSSDCNQTEIIDYWIGF